MKGDKKKYTLDIWTKGEKVGGIKRRELILLSDWLERMPLTHSTVKARLRPDSPTGPASAPWPPRMRSHWSRGWLACYTLMAGAGRGQGGRRRRRERMGKRREVEEEEEDWRRRRRQEWRRRMGMGWREQKEHVKEGALLRSHHKLWEPCCRVQWRGWRSEDGGRAAEVGGWGPLVLWCLICFPSGMKEEHANTHEKTNHNKAHTILTPLWWGF